MYVFALQWIFILERVNVLCVTMAITTNPGVWFNWISIKDENKPHTVVIHDLHTIGYMASLLMGWDCLPNYHGWNTIERWLVQKYLSIRHHGIVNMDSANVSRNMFEDGSGCSAHTLIIRSFWLQSQHTTRSSGHLTQLIPYHPQRIWEEGTSLPWLVQDVQPSFVSKVHWVEEGVEQVSFL